jgi:hypothetical protein
MIVHIFSCFFQVCYNAQVQSAQWQYSLHNAQVQSAQWQYSLHNAQVQSAQYSLHSGSTVCTVQSAQVYSLHNICRKNPWKSGLMENNLIKCIKNKIYIIEFNLN